MPKKLRSSWSKLSDTLTAYSMIFGDGVLSKSFNCPSANRRKKRLVVLAHYSNDGEIHPHIHHFIDSMRNCNCDVMIVSTSNSLPCHEIENVKRKVIATIVRTNVGYDFGSWKTAIDSYPDMQKDYDTVIFANDSVYGPFCDMAAILDSADQMQLDAWSLTSSMERQYHLQTYFWALSNNGLKGDFFSYFWQHYYRFYSRRQTVINKYELKVAQIAQEKYGLQVGACFEIEDMFSAALKKMDGDSHSIFNDITKINPMHHLWRELIRNQGFPFIKRELLTSNPFKLESEVQIFAALRQIDPELLKVVSHHLQHHKTQQHSHI